MAPARFPQARPPVFETQFALKPGVADNLIPGLCRILAPNPGAMTFTGTLTYLIGEKAPIIVDPGPDEPRHLEAIIKTLAGRPVSGILLTHSHRDHDGLTETLIKHTGAPIWQAKAGQIWQHEAWQIEAIATPGHAADHYCYWLAQSKILLSGDHVMTWSTSMVEDMAAYMQSLDVVMALKPAMLLPGHGPEKRQAGTYLRALKTHRRLREAAILKQYQAGIHSPEAITRALYAGLSPQVFSSAIATTKAHLLHLAQQGKIALETPIQPDEED